MIGLSCSAAFAAPAPAPQHQAPPKQLSCRADADRFCSNVMAGEGRRLACLVSHMKELDPSCQKLVPIMQAIFEYGKQQHIKTMKIIAERKAAEEKAAAAKAGDPAPQH